jgi:hypothetical protein
MVLPYLKFADSDMLKQMDHCWVNDVSKGFWINTHPENTDGQDSQHEKLAAIDIGQCINLGIGDCAKDNALDHP